MSVEERPRAGRCRCGGRYEGCNHGPGNRRCNEPGGGRWSPYFCAGCDERRVKHIGANLAEIAGVIE